MATKVHKTTKQKISSTRLATSIGSDPSKLVLLTSRKVNQATIIAIEIMRTKQPKTGIDSLQNFENRFMLFFKNYIFGMNVVAISRKFVYMCLIFPKKVESWRYKQFHEFLVFYIILNLHYFFRANCSNSDHWWIQFCFTSWTKRSW